MADSILTTSGIKNLVYNYQQNEIRRRITPLTNKKDSYKFRSSAFNTLSSKLSTFHTYLDGLKDTGTYSKFLDKAATASNNSFLSATATTTASIGSYAIRVNQLAKNDLVISKDIDTSATTANTLGITDGTYDFTIKTGDGSTGEYLSNISVDLTTAQTNQEVMEAIRDAINSDKAIVESSAKTDTTSYTGGTTSFKINLNGTETTISDSGGGTYSDLLTRLADNVNTNVDGVTAEVVTTGTDVQLKFTVDNVNNYISVTHDSGFDLVSDLGIATTKEKGAAGTVTASVFSPATGKSQFSLSSKSTGLDYRIKDLSDSTGTALDVLGLNLGTSRTSYDQSTDPDTPGFLYSDITSANNQLNSKLDFNGISVQRNTNTISDLVTGVTFSMTSTMDATDDDVNVTVENDVTELKAEVQDFIDKFNDVYTYIKNNSSSENGARGPFVGESLASTLKSRLTTMAYAEVTGLTDGALNKLSQIGVTFDVQNGLTISDDTLLESEIKTNVDQIEDMFNSTDGLANQLYDLIDPYVGSTGYVTNLKDGLDDSITYYNNRIDSIQKQIDKSAEVYRTKYEKLQAQLAVIMNSQSFMSSITGGYY